jgi:anti-sigma28 factor (negative regulator of flagellin synthesis)
MSGIAPLGPGSITQANAYQYRSSGAADAAGSDATGPQRESDSIELSPTARRLALLDRVLTDPPVRQELIDQVRQEIESGRYDLSGKLDHVVEEMWSDFTEDEATAE